MVLAYCLITTGSLLTLGGFVAIALDRNASHSVANI
jgi:hypothetical protein